jgi:hypothetical protein
MTHQEFMEKRHNKKKKKNKKSVEEKKKELLMEYMELNKEETPDHKSVSMSIMEEIEEIKEKMNDHSYLKIMDLLMALNKGATTPAPRQSDWPANRFQIPEFDRHVIPEWHRPARRLTVDNINESLDNTIGIFGGGSSMAYTNYRSMHSTINYDSIMRRIIDDDSS